MALFIIEVAVRKGQRAGIAQLGERQTEDLKVACSIHAHRSLSSFFIYLFFKVLPFFLG